MVNITVDLLPPFSSYTKDRQIKIVLQDNTKFIDLIRQLIDSYPQMQEMIPDLNDENVFYSNVFPVLNNRLARQDEILNDGDKIILCGAVTGG